MPAGQFSGRLSSRNVKLFPPASVTDGEWDRYVRQGGEYQTGLIESKEIGHWAAPIVARAFQEAFRRDPKGFVRTLFREMRVGTNLILTVVDSQARFRGYVTRFGSAVRSLTANPESLRFESRGISVFFGIEETEVCHLDLYMLSYSGGKGNRLRGAIRSDFEIDVPG
jgi:hypothetical protein